MQPSNLLLEACVRIRLHSHDKVWGSQICALRGSFKHSSPSSGLHLPSCHSHRKRAPQAPRPLAEPWLAAPDRGQQGEPSSWRRLALQGGAAAQRGGRGEQGPTRPRGDRGIHCSVLSRLLIFLYFSLLRCSLSVPELSHTSHFLKDTGVPAEQNGNINTVHCYQVLIIKLTTVIFNWDKIQQCSDRKINGIFGYICIHKIISSKV